jgi:proteasome assembly chaperone (PAC2) family protein
VQYTIFHDESGALVGAAGVLFSIAGQNDINAIYPNISLYYYWSKKGAPQMR